MKYCPECGSIIEGMKFCSECGFKALRSVEKVDSQTEGNEEKTIFEFSTHLLISQPVSKKIIGNLDVSIPVEHYILTNERLIINKKGMLKSSHEEIDLYKIEDVKVKQTLAGKAMGIGDLTLFSSDSTTPVIVLKAIKEPVSIADGIKKAVRNAKKSLNVIYRKDL